MNRLLLFYIVLYHPVSLSPLRTFQSSIPPPTFASCKSSRSRRTSCWSSSRSRPHRSRGVRRQDRAGRLAGHRSRRRVLDDPLVIHLGTLQSFHLLGREHLDDRLVNRIVKRKGVSDRHCCIASTEVIFQGERPSRTKFCTGPFDLISHVPGEHE